MILFLLVVLLVSFSACDMNEEPDEITSKYNTLTIEMEGEGLISWNRIDEKGYLDSATETKELEIENDALVNLTAKPDEDYIFSSWEGQVQDTRSTETSVMVNKDQNVKAIFYEIHDGEFIRVSADEGKGFYWDYILYVPNEIDKNNKDYIKNMLVIPNNTGYLSDEYEEHYQEAKNTHLYYFVARELKTPLIIPVFPRPRTIEGAPKDFNYYTHILDRGTMKLEIEEYERLDKQLISMIDHSQNILENKGLNLKQEVLMWGFSASGHFINRFVMLHPERIQAAAYGGFSEIILPLTEMEVNGEVKDLIYSVGISDIEKIIGKSFNEEAYKNIPQYITRGKADYNDHLLNEDKKVKDLIIEVFDTEPAYGDTLEDAKLIIDRHKLAKEVYEEKGVLAEFEFYEDLGHDISEKMMNNMIGFLKENAEN